MSYSKGKGKKSFKDEKEEKKGTGQYNTDIPSTKVTTSKSSYAKGGKGSSSKGRRGDNDISWYSRLPRLLQDAASIAYGMPSGLKYPLDTVRYLEEVSDQSEIRNETPDTFELPTILVAKACTGVGYSVDETSAINVASRNLYSWVRHANSGSANYDSPDLMLYIQAVREVYSFISMCQRLYGSLCIASAYNRSYPRYIVYAQGFDYDTFTTKIAQYRSWLNQFIVKAGALCVPAVFTQFMRDYWLYGNIWIDNPSMKSSLYMYRPIGFRRYVERAAGQAGYLEFKQFGSSLDRVTMDELIAYGEDMLGRLIQSEDIGIMSGDILKAFGEGSLMKLGTVPEDFMTIPSESIEALEQFKNIKPMHNFSKAAHNAHIPELDITQDPSFGTLYFNPTYPLFDDPSDPWSWGPNAAEYLAQTGTRTITTMDPNPSAETTMLNTRCTCGAPVIKANTNLVEYPAQPTTLVFQLSILGPTTGESTLQFVNKAITDEVSNSISSGQYYTDMMAVEELSHFRFHPEVWFGTLIVDPSAYPNTAKWKGAKVFDLDNFGFVSNANLGLIHNAALQSMFAVPELGLFQ